MRRWSTWLSGLVLVLAGVAAASAQARFPVAGRPINMIVPFAAGGPTDAAARLLVPTLEKELGTQITVVNKPGASTQIGVTQLATSKPDGYTIGFVSLPQLQTIYLDPERKAVFGRKDLQPLAMHVVDPMVVVVRKDSPFNSMKELLDFAKANPGKLKSGDGGFMGATHLAWLDVERQTGVRTAMVHFDGSAPGVTALLGGHIDLQIDTVAGVFNRVKSGEFKALGIMDSQESPFIPGVKTLASQGLNVDFSVSRGLVAPAGVPKDVADKLAAALEKAINSDDHKKRMADMGQTVRYMSPAEFSAFLQAQDAEVKTLMELAKAGATTKN